MARRSVVVDGLGTVLTFVGMVWHLVGMFVRFLWNARDGIRYNIRPHSVVHEQSCSSGQKREHNDNTPSIEPSSLPHSPLTLPGPFSKRTPSNTPTRPVSSSPLTIVCKGHASSALRRRPVSSSTLSHPSSVSVSSSSSSIILEDQKTPPVTFAVKPHVLDGRCDVFRPIPQRPTSPFPISSSSPCILASTGPSISHRRNFPVPEIATVEPPDSRDLLSDSELMREKRRKRRKGIHKHGGALLPTVSTTGGRLSRIPRVSCYSSGGEFPSPPPSLNISVVGH